MSSPRTSESSESPPASGRVQRNEEVRLTAVSHYLQQSAHIAEGSAQLSLLDQMNRSSAGSNAIILIDNEETSGRASTPSSSMGEDRGVDSNSDDSYLDAMDEDESEEEGKDEDTDDDEEEDENENAYNDEISQDLHFRMEIESYVKAFGHASMNHSVEKHSVDLIGMDGMIMHYLVENGYSEAAEAFQSEAFLTNLDTTSSSSSFADESISCGGNAAMNQANLFGVRSRASVIDAILKGDITRAVAEIEHIDSSIFADRPTLLFKLRLQEFVEYLREPMGYTPTKAVAFAKKNLSEFLSSSCISCPEDERVFQDMETVLTLLLFIKPVTGSDPSCQKLPIELTNLIKLKRRRFLADEINNALLERVGFKAGECKITSVLLELSATQDKILKKYDENAIVGSIMDISSRFPVLHGISSMTTNSTY